MATATNENCSQEQPTSKTSFVITAAQSTAKLAAEKPLCKLAGKRPFASAYELSGRLNKTQGALIAASQRTQQWHY